MPRKWIALLLLPGLLWAQAPPEPTPDFKESLTFVVELAKHYEILDDHPDLERVNRIGYSLVKALDRPKDTYCFQIIKMREPNAFALPAGFIFLTSGILEMGLSDDALAAILGHEIIHAQNDHSRKMQRRNALLSVLSNALVLGAILGAANSGERRDPNQPDLWTLPDSQWGQYQRQSEGANLIQASIAFSVVMQALLMQDYSRDFEMEADREGTYLTARAGFDPRGAVELLDTMKRRTYETPGYGYWRSHPYLEDRATMAEVRTGQLRPSSQMADPEGIQRQTQEVLNRFAQGEKDPDRARALERMARNASPAGLTSFLLRRKALEETAGALMSRPFTEREYWPVLRGYERLLERFAEDPEVTGVMEKARGELERYREENEACRGAFHGILDFGVPSIPFLKSFVANYPDDLRTPYASVLLARSLFQLGEERDAVEALARARASGDALDRDMAEAVVRPRLHLLRSITACHRLGEIFADTPLAPLIRERFEAVLPLVDSLKEARDFLDAYPDAEAAPRVTGRLESLAQSEWVRARVFERMGDRQRALDIVNTILENAPESTAAERIRNDILQKANLEGGPPS